MKPFDPRLLRHASVARWFLLAGAALGLAQTVVIVSIAFLLSQSVVRAIDGAPFAAQLGGLAACFVLRSVLGFVVELVALRGAAAVKRELRSRLLAGLVQNGPEWLGATSAARVSSVATSGLDALDGYFARYLPQLILTAVATPAIVAVMFWQDVVSGVTVIVVLPLIPVFMVLIGLATRTAQRDQWESLQRLGSGFLDVVGGLATLKVFRREGRQPARIAALSEEYRSRTMAVLRVSFLSGFVLELAASLSVALVAVTIGLRLVDGSLALGVGLFVLLLAPEAFLPLRQVGAQFHAAADGLAAASEVMAILEVPATRADVSAGDSSTLVLTGVEVVRAGRTLRFDAEFRPGELSVITGESGVGKSTLVAAIRGTVPFSGTLTLPSRSLSPRSPRSLSPRSPRSPSVSKRPPRIPAPTAQLAWAGQRPALLAGTIAANVALGDTIDHAAIRHALADAGAGALDPSTELGASGEGLSGGESQRVAIARALYRARRRDCAIVILDEPTSALDRDSEAVLITGLRALAAEGRIVIVVSHRTAVINAADHLIQLQQREVARV